MIRFSVLSSSSKANSTFIEAGNTRILIDCGLSARQTGLRLAGLGIDPATIDYVLVTHEHRDHIFGVPVFSKRFKAPVVCNAATREFLHSVYAVELFETGCPFQLGDIKVSPFSITHDAAEPVGYVLESDGLKLTQVTDLGKVTPLVRDAVSGSNALVLESNHDPEMLSTCDYPWELKQRISSSHGHLSNQEAAELIAETMHPELFHVVLAHLSENSNRPEMALEAMDAQFDRAALSSLCCGSFYAPTPLVDLSGFESRLAVRVG
jgi:phosphoribosyl 1,2-cyclic phosphodiesterase